MCKKIGGEGNEVKCKKVLNNNVLLVLDNNDNERIIMGKGIGWQINPGDIFSSNCKKIDQTFISNNSNYINTFKGILKKVNISDIEIASKIMKDSEKTLAYKCSDNMLFF